MTLFSLPGHEATNLDSDVRPHRDSSLVMLAKACVMSSDAVHRRLTAEQQVRPEQAWGETQIYVDRFGGFSLPQINECFTMT